MKISIFKPIENNFFIVAIFLLKKAIVLSYLNEMSLTNGNNVFNMPNFDNF